MPQAGLPLSCRLVCPALLTAPGLWEKRDSAAPERSPLRLFKSSHCVFVAFYTCFAALAADPGKLSQPPSSIMSTGVLKERCVVLGPSCSSLCSFLSPQ